MVNVTVDEPLALVVPPAVMVAVWPPTFTVKAEVGAKPCAEMVTGVVPTGPVIGDKPLTEELTVKVVEAVSGPESLAVMVSAPCGPFGTVKVADQVPLAATVWVAIVTAVPLKVTLAVFTVSVGV
jgi:hypothetical protein